MLTADHVRLAYNLFLDREPREEELESQLAGAHSPRALTEQLLASSEFAGREAAFRPYLMEIRSIGGFSFDFLIADPTGENWYGGWTTGRGLPESEWCMARIRDGMTVLDCGAHHGLYSVAFAKAVGPSGRVVAWEAWPAAAAVAEWNLVLNGCDNARVRAVALGDGNPAGQFHVIQDVVSAAWGDGSQSLPTVSLDADLPPGTRVDFIKMDVEGSELEVLRGAHNTLSRRPVINLEIHNFLYEEREETLGQLEEILKPLGYYYWLQEVEVVGEVRPLGPHIDLRQLAHCENPHLFCEPK